MDRSSESEIFTALAPANEARGEQEEWEVQD
jgi:hypothetical protein